MKTKNNVPAYARLSRRLRHRGLAGLTNYMIERNFFSVGQALFCREKVNNRTVMYDCGGQTEAIIKNVIDAEYPARNTEVIDALFISHYDKDHINGVFHLLNRCRVNHLFLPMVSSLSRMLSFYGWQYTSQMRQFYADPKSYIQQTYGGTQVHYVEQSERVVQTNEPVDIERFNGRDIPNVSLIRFRDNPDWVYIPFNRKLMTTQEETQFLGALGLPANASFADILTKWRRQRLSFKAIVGRLGIIDIRKINDYSMTLYSGSISQRNACLFLGDYNAHSYFADLQNAYRPLWGNIRVIQVPHHGSIHNYHCGLCQQGTEYVVSNKPAPYTKTQVNPDLIIRHIKTIAGQPCYTTFGGDVVLH